MTRVMFVCLGNICRSTMAESVFTHMVRERGIEDNFVIQSSATSSYEIGNPPHHGTVNKLREVGIPVVEHRSTQLKKSDYDKYDYIIGMDDSNIRDIKKIFGGKSDKVYTLLSFAGKNDSIADPWYTGNFDETYRDVCEGLEGFLEKLGY